MKINPWRKYITYHENIYHEKYLEKYLENLALSYTNIPPFLFLVKRSLSDEKTIFRAFTT